MLRAATKKRVRTYEARKREPQFIVHRQRWLKSARGTYWQHKANAKKRGIPWEFTFESWWQLWQKSGHWEERGNRVGKYCMGRKGDVGPYGHANCAIVLFEQNLADARTRRVRIVTRYVGRSRVVTYK